MFGVPACNAKLAAIYYLRYFYLKKVLSIVFYFREVLSVVLPVPKEYKNTTLNSAIYRRDPKNENTAGICLLVYGPGLFGPFGSNPRF
jgi:hypothetical protein